MKKLEESTEEYDKLLEILKANDIRTARWINVSSVDEIDYDKIEEMGYPVFVKPTNGGSSVATFKVKEKSEIRAAVEEGIIGGGGSAYIHVSKKVKEFAETLEGDEKTGAKIILKALEAPLAQIAKNAGLEGAVIVNKVRESEVGTGFDAYNETYVDMVEKGILDPAKVTRSALQNATSVASTLLTTESVVSTIKEDTPAMPAGGAGGMGMM